MTSITSKNKKKVLSASNKDVNTNVKLHVTIRPESTTLKQSNLPIKMIASESTLTHKETTQTIIDLSDDLTEPTKDLDAETTQEEPQKIEVSMPPIKGTKRKKQVLKKEVKSNDDAKWTDSEIKILLEFWKENLEEWKRGKVKVYQKIISENVLPGRTLDQIRNKVGKLRETYLQKKKKANSTGEGSVEWIWFSQMEEILSQSKAINPDYVTDSTSDSPPISDGENSDNKENYKADETRKKKRKSTGIEGISGVIAAMGESRDRFYEKKLDLEERESQKKFELEEKKSIQQYELEKSKLEIERLRAENEKVKLELEMLKFRKNNE
ncbi:hypothetical protein RhiirC2_851816 [Rhizophagus irregularis]|uniref:Myb/SANT-like DNA-binding domain-containing protein n=2 Tax=Rhizophagus irregularis TaxID=588596 RepID=A0A2N1N201_9GLOM|nr:hypothetical protein RhiirC2_851816 [Rhizophagus irregularis]